MTPLPEPAYQRLSDLQSGIDDYYTEQQMRDYGKAEFERGLRAALEQQAEPVAYCYVKKGSSADDLTFDQNPADAVSGTVFPLYATPPQRKPLTDADIKLVMNGRGEEGDDDYIKPAFDPYGISEDDLIDFARAIEQAHDIKEKP